MAVLGRPRDFSMQLSKASYYSDYVAYPIVIAGLATVGLAGESRGAVIEWLAALGCGLVLWTLMEYVVHRVALHRVPVFVPMHGLHHSAPLAYVGTPTWLSVSLLGAGLFAPAWFVCGLSIATGITVGVMAGYVYYGAVHHLIHHRRSLDPAGRLHGLRAAHLRHHYSPQQGNFGVTTGIWDRVFGTVIQTAGKSR
jgi:sterol desaturase/sphingolipid hydroxylase (fatty acid hydroxylase superfamily)